MVDAEDFGQLQVYLRNAGRIGSQEAVNIRLLAGGVSNKTLLVIRPSGESWVIKQALAKLRVQSDWFSHPARIHVEANGLRNLPLVTPKGSTTPLVFEDTAENLLAMQAVPEPYENWKQLLLAGEISRDLFGQFARLLGSIHRESLRLRHKLGPLFADKQFFKTLRLEPYYEFSARVVPQAAPFLEQLVAWTLSRFDTLVHGDFSPKNVLVHSNRLVLLDHEVLHFGDPAFDVGFSLTHFLAKALHLPQKRQEFVQGALHYWKIYVDEVCGTPWSAHLDFRAAEHTLASLLARVCGRSPLEYLSKEECALQRKIVVAMMMEKGSPTVEKVITEFSTRLAAAQEETVVRQ